MKIEAILNIKKLKRVLIEEKSEDIAQIKEKIVWEKRNQDTIAYIRLNLSDKQALEFAAGNNSQLWSKRHIRMQSKIRRLSQVMI